MRVAVFNGPGRIEIEDRPDEPLGPTEVRIEVARCGICGSDVSMTGGSAFDYAHGRAIGHEPAGTVIELGRDVDSLRLGDRVAVLPRGYCGQCTACRAGRPLFCETGPAHFGGFGERMVISQQCGFRLPESCSHAEGALVEPVACGRKAMRMARLERGESVLVLGAGSMGLAAIYWARRLGAGRVVVATRSASRHETALAVGADTALVLEEGREAEQVAALLPGGADIVVEAIGKPGQLLRAAQLVRPLGRVISLGMCLVHDPVLPALHAFSDTTFHFPLGYSVEDFAETLRAFDADRLRPELMVSEVAPLSALARTIEEMRGPGNPHHKVQIAPNQAG